MKLRSLSLFSNAILAKELAVTARRVGTYRLRGAYVALLLVAVAWVYLVGVVEQQRHSSGAASLQRLSMMTPLLTVVLSGAQFVLLTLTAAVVTSGSIVSEHRQGSLATLLTTPLTALQIVLGKVAAAVVHLLVLGALGVPILLALRALGGMDVSDILRLMGVGLLSAFQGACVGTAISTVSKRALGAMVGAVVVLLAINFLPLIILLLLWGGAGGPTQVATILAFSPVASIFGLSMEAMGEQAFGGPTRLNAYFALHAGISLGISLLWLWFAAVRLRGRLAALGSGDVPREILTGLAPSTPPAPTAQPASPASLAPIVAPAGATIQAPATSREVGDHPVLWRELRERFSRAPWYVAAMVVMTILLAIPDWGVEGWIGSCTVIGTLATLLVSALASVGAFPSEREARTLDVLLTTPLTARELAYSKLLGSLRRMLPFLAFLLVVVLFQVVRSPLWIVPAFMAWMVTLACVVFTSASGMWLGLVMRRSTAAAAVNLLLLATILILPLIVIATIDEVSRGISLDDWFVVPSAYNPFVVGVSAVASGRWRHETRPFWNARFDFPAGDLRFWGFALATLGGTVFWLALACVPLAATLGRLRRESGRAR